MHSWDKHARNAADRKDNSVDHASANGRKPTPDPQSAPYTLWSGHTRLLRRGAGELARAHVDTVPTIHMCSRIPSALLVAAKIRRAARSPLICDATMTGGRNAVERAGSGRLWWAHLLLTTSCPRSCPTICAGLPGTVTLQPSQERSAGALDQPSAGHRQIGQSGHAQRLASPWAGQPGARDPA